MTIDKDFRCGVCDPCDDDEGEACMVVQLHGELDQLRKKNKDVWNMAIERAAVFLEKTFDQPTMAGEVRKLKEKR